jgi:Tol biopolymer transport system component
LHHWIKDSQLSGITMKPIAPVLPGSSRRLAGFFLAGVAAVAMVLVGCSKSTDSPSIIQTYRHIRPAWSPDGSTIAFTGIIRDTLGIYLVDTTGANVRLLRAGDGIGVTWSPDSRWIAFSSNDTLLAIRVTGDSTMALTDGSGNIRPSWSPDGLRIAYVRRPGSLWLLNISSKVSIDLGRNPVDYPSWNPSTSELVYLAPDYYSNSQGIIYEFKALDIPADTARVLYSILTNYEVGFSSISPTGDRLIFSVSGEGSYIQLYAADLLLRSSEPITDDGGDYGAWSPEGARVVYTRIQEGDGCLWIMYADGSGKRRLTSP